MQSRYYNPEMGRFINADEYISTGQGVLGHNMFAYCGNNPVTRTDNNGDSWVTIGVGLAVAGITGLSNGYSSYIAGGQFWPAFGIGVGAGGIGYALALATKNPMALVSIRSMTSLGSNLLTTKANNGTVTIEDWFSGAWDAIMDGVFSTFTYYYNPLSGFFSSNAFNAVIDGITDIAESWLYNSPPKDNSPQVDMSANRSPVRKVPKNYVPYGDLPLLN